jgi:hypothetical protein
MADRAAGGGTVADVAEPGASPPGKRHLRYRIAFFVTALMVLSIVVTLPFSVKSVVDDVLGPSTGRVIYITKYVPGAELPVHAKLHLAFVSIDETQLLATLRVSGHHHCPNCPWSQRVLFVAISADAAEAAGLPPSAVITLPPDGIEVSQMIQLPVRGHPIHYPFDQYRVVIGVALQGVFPDGRVESRSAEQARGHFFLSIQELLPRQMMVGPFLLDPASVRAPDDPYPYIDAFEVLFERPRYLRVLAVMLVLLVAAAAAYSVFLRPLNDLVMNSGALVLGVWGIRAILTPSNIYYITAIDLALSVVIIFLLGAITVRALVFVHDEAELGLFGRRRRGPPGAPGDTGRR